MKKLLALCLTVVIVLAMVPIFGASAADTAVFTVSDATGYPGDEVTVAVSIAANPGLTFAQIMVGYYAEALEVVNIEKLTFAGKQTSSSPTTANPLKVTYDNCLEDIYDTGDLANVTFKIKDDAPIGTYTLTVKAEQENVFDVAFNDVPFTCENAVITVKCPHTEKTTHAAVESTCLVQGNEEYKTCNACGEVVDGSDAKLPFGSHAPVEVVDDKYFVSDATCTEKTTYYKSCSVCGEATDEKFVVGELLPHTFVEVVDDKYSAADASCTDKAKYYLSCSVCGEASDETFDAGELLEHSWVEVVDDKYFVSDATCAEKAKYNLSCSVCGVAHTETFETGEVNADNHVGGKTTHAAVESTCEVAGNEEYVTCDDCGVVIEGSDAKLPLADHSFGEWYVAVKPTFDATGLYQRDCLVCSHFETEEIPARIPAEFSVSVNADRVAPGEEVEVVVSLDSNPGITGASLWLNYDSSALEIVEFVSAGLDGRDVECSEIDNNPAIIRWIGFDDSYATGALVTIKFVVKADAVDGDYAITLSTNQDEVFDKDFDDVAYNLTDDSLKISSCCPDGQHVWTQVVADEYLATVATCNLKATYFLSCSECPEIANATFEAGEFDANNHVGTTTTHPAVKSTCAVAGNEEYVTCDDCGAVVEGSDAKLELIPHTFVEVVDDKYLASEATCTAKAQYYLSCSVCGAASDETFEDGEVLPHTWADIVDDKYLITVADCVSRAVYYQSCSECGETNLKVAFVDGKVDPTNHIATTTTHAAVESTCTVAGNEEYVTCDDCGAVVEGSDAKLELLPHTFEEIVDDKYLVKAATCIEKATYYKSCSVCGEASEEIFEAGDVAGHVWVEVVDDKYFVSEATCIAKAVYYKSCSVCGEASEETFETGDFADHAFDDDADLACNVCKYTRAPGAPVLVKANATTVELVAIEGYEYSIDGVNWQSSNVFENLEANTEYSFYQRVAATDTHDASAASEALLVLTSVVIGDVNLDGKINGKDAVLLIQFINGYDVEIFELAADINGDGEINGKDHVLLIQYLNGYEIEYFNK